MSSTTIDRAELEDRVRAALAQRARSTVVDVPDDFTPGAFLPPDAGRRSRRNLLVAAAALAVVVLGIAALLVRDDDGVDSQTGETPDGAAPGTPVHGPTGSPWFVLDLPGLSPPESSRQSTEAVSGGLSELQAFRTDAGFDGPAVWLEPGASSGTGEGTQVTVHGKAAFVLERGDVITLSASWEDGFYLTAVHLTVDDLVALAEGLEPRDGGGWDATVLPRGLVEVTAEEPPRPPSEHSELSYTGADGTNYELFVDPGGPAVFEDRARELAASGDTIEAISVDGRPGLLIDSGAGETMAVWRPTDDVVADFRSSLDRDGLLAAMEALRPVNEADWPGDQDPAAGG